MDAATTTNFDDLNADAEEIETSHTNAMNLASAVAKNREAHMKSLEEKALEQLNQAAQDSTESLKSPRLLQILTITISVLYVKIVYPFLYIHEEIYAYISCWLILITIVLLKLAMLI